MSHKFIIESILDAKINGLELFTAYDITLSARDKGHRVKHDEVRPIVHAYHDSDQKFSADYTKTLINVTNTETSWLYHPVGADINTYLSKLNVNQQPQQVVLSPGGGLIGNFQPIAIPNFNSAPVVQTTQKVQQAGVLKSRIVDGRGSLSIPAQLVRQAGFITGQKVFARGENDKVVVSSVAQTSKKYTVNRSCQIRITQPFLSKCGLKGQKYDIDFQNGEILISLS